MEKHCDGSIILTFCTGVGGFVPFLLKETDELNIGDMFPGVPSIATTPEVGFCKSDVVRFGVVVIMFVAPGVVIMFGVPALLKADCEFCLANLGEII